MKISAFAIVAALLPFGGAALAGEMTAMPLASVAHQLGFGYAYLGPDDEVSLTGHGLAIIVRPGDPFFTVNDRIEPVEGGAPRYQSGDLYVAPEFAHQLMAIEQAAAANERTDGSKMAGKSLHINGSPMAATAHHVLAVAMTQVPGSEDVEVSGKATPGALVEVLLTADVAPELPTIYLNRSFATTLADGTFSVDIATAPNYFSGSALVADASSIDDAQPMTARFVPVTK